MVIMAKAVRAADVVGQVAAVPEAARAASPVTVSTKLFIAPAATGQSVCVVVTVVRGGQLSPSSLATCGTAS